jgi:predicted trehalose synthase
VLLDAFLLEKALAEVRVELSYRPDWAIIPLRGIANILES